MTADRVAAIEARLRQAFNVQRLKVLDQSHLHAGHAGAATGKGHFAVTLVADEFSSLGTLERHRAIYAALGELMDTEIHALTIDASPPDKE